MSFLQKTFSFSYYVSPLSFPSSTIPFDGVPSDNRALSILQLTQYLLKDSFSPFSPTLSSESYFDSSSSPRSSSISYSPPILRRSIRDRHPSLYLKDFDCDPPIQHSPHIIAQILSYDHFSPTNKIFYVDYWIYSEPKTYHEATKLLEWQ